MDVDEMLGPRNATWVPSMPPLLSSDLKVSGLLGQNFGIVP